MFLIPVAIVGYKVYNDHKKREALAKGREELSVEQPAQENDDNEHLMTRAKCTDNEGLSSSSVEINDSADSSDTDQSRVCSVPDNDAADNIGKTLYDDLQSPTALTCAEPLAGFMKAWLRYQEDRRAADPCVIKNNQDLLTYEVLGNQGANAVPFPKTSFQ